MRNSSASTEPSEEFDLDITKYFSGISFSDASDEDYDSKEPVPVAVDIRKPMPKSQPSSIGTTDDINVNEEIHYDTENREIYVIEFKNAIGSFKITVMNDDIQDDFLFELDKTTGTISKTETSDPAVMQEISSSASTEPSEEFDLDVMKSFSAISFSDESDSSHEAYDSKEPVPLTDDIRKPMPKSGPSPIGTTDHSINVNEELDYDTANREISVIVLQSGIGSFKLKEATSENNDFQLELEKTNGTISTAETNDPAVMRKASSSASTEPSEEFDLDITKSYSAISFSDTSDSSNGAYDNKESNPVAVQNPFERHGGVEHNGKRGRAAKGFRSSPSTTMIEVRAPYNKQTGLIV